MISCFEEKFYYSQFVEIHNNQEINKIAGKTNQFQPTLIKHEVDGATTGRISFDLSKGA